MLGFHVHEKAITPYISILLMFVDNVPFMNIAVFVNIVNLIPLMIQPGERILCVMFCALWLTLWDIYRPNDQSSKMYNDSELNIHEMTNIFQLLKITGVRNVVEETMKISGWALVMYYCVIQEFIRSKSL